MHVFSNRMSVELALMREFGHSSRLNCFEDQLLMLTEESAQFCKFGIVHFRYPLIGTMLRYSLLCRQGAAVESLALRF